MLAAVFHCITIYKQHNIYALYIQLTIYFHLQNGQDDRPLRSPLHVTQILATEGKGSENRSAPGLHEANIYIQQDHVILNIAQLATASSNFH